MGNDNELAGQRLSSSRGARIPTFHRTHESPLVWRITVLQCGDKMTGDAPTARTGALAQSHPGLCGTLVGPGKDTHGTRREAAGGPRHASRDTTETTRPR